MIPKTIHLCWFGAEPYPPLVELCMKSWERHLPDYEIKIWNREMALETCIPFVAEAIENEKWAFAADVIRLYALYHEGGVYMDSDIFLKSRFDEFLSNDFVSFQEYHLCFIDKKATDEYGNRRKMGVIPGIGIQAAFMASVPGHYFVKALLDYYARRAFLLPDGSLNTRIIAPAIYAMEAETLGYKYIDKTQILGGATIYESKFLAGDFTEDSEDAFAIHCCNNSWRERSVKEKALSIIRDVLHKSGIRRKKTGLDYLNSLIAG